MKLRFIDVPVYLLSDHAKLAPTMSEQAVEKPEDNTDATYYDTNSVVGSSQITDVRHSLVTVKYSHEFNF